MAYLVSQNHYCSCCPRGHKKKSPVVVQPRCQRLLPPHLPSRQIIHRAFFSNCPFLNISFKWVYLTDGASGQIWGNLFPGFLLKGGGNHKAGKHSKCVQKWYRDKKYEKVHCHILLTCSNQYALILNLVTIYEQEQYISPIDRSANILHVNKNTRFLPQNKTILKKKISSKYWI